MKGEWGYLLVSTHDELHPSIDGFGRSIVEIIVGYAISRQKSLKPLLIQDLAVVDIILLGGDHGQIVLFVAPILAELDAADDLLVDEVGGDRVVGRLVPRSEDLFAEKEAPRGVALLGALLFRVLLTL